MWAMSGVWLLDSIVPFCSMKLSRFGIISRSEGTFGIVPKKVDIVERELDHVLDAIAELAAHRKITRSGSRVPGQGGAGLGYRPSRQCSHGRQRPQQRDRTGDRPEPHEPPAMTTPSTHKTSSIRRPGLHAETDS